MRRTLALIVVLGLTVAGTAPALRGQGYDYSNEAKFTRDLLSALENGNKADAERLMTGKPAAANDVIKSLPDPNSPAARTAYDVRKQTAERVMKETVRRMNANPETRGRLISVELGGTAGKEGQGFTPKTADLDFQFRGVDPDASRAARDIAMQVMGELNVPDEFKINPFAANPDEVPLSGTTKDLNKSQLERVETAQRRRLDTQASKGDANDAVRADYYERGVAYEIDPVTGELRSDPQTGELRKKSVEDLYKERGWDPPAVTEASAFGTAANERAQFTTLSEDAKRVFRAADALDRVDPAALTPDERATVDLARRIYQARDPTKAVQSLSRNNPIRQAYEAAVKGGRTPADALNDLMVGESARARAICDKAMERTLDAKLADIDRTLAMSDRDLLLEQGRRSAAGEEAAQNWLRDYKDAAPDAKAEMVKTAREGLAEQKRLGLIETFAYLKTEVLNVVAKNPRFAENEFVKNAVALAEVMSGRNEALNRGREALSDLVDSRATTPDKGPVTSAEYHPGYPGGGVIRAADRALIAIALTGALDDIVSETLKAYDKGGKGAAVIMFVQKTAGTAKDVAVGMAIQYMVEQTGLFIERRGLLPLGATAAANAALTVYALVEISKVIGNAVWRAAQDPFLRTSLDPDAPISFYQVMNTRPLTLAADIRTYAKNNQKRLNSLRIKPDDTAAVLRLMIKDYAGDSGVKATWTTGMDQRMLDGLTGQAERSDDFLTNVSLSMMKSTSRAADATARKPTDSEAGSAAADEAKAKADADEVARRARAARREKDARKAAAEQAAKDKLVAEKAAKDKAAKVEAARERAEQERLAREAEEAKAAPPSSVQSRWTQLSREGQAEQEAQRRREEEARLRQEAEAAERLRQAEEAALLEDVEIDINVPASLQPGEEGVISVSVRTPRGVRLSGRRVGIRASPGHTDDGSIPLSAGGRGQTVYVAPDDYNGYVRVTANFEGFGQVSRTFLVGKAVAEAPPEQRIENSKEITLPETPEPATVVEIAFATDEGRGTGRFEIKGGTGAGRITYDGSTELEGEYEGAYTKTACRDQWSAELPGATASSDLIQGAGTITKTLRCANGLNGSAAGTHTTRLRLQPGGRLQIEISISIDTQMTDGAGRVLQSGHETNSETQAGSWTMSTKR